MNENPNTQNPQPNSNTQPSQPNQAPQNGQTAPSFNPAYSVYATPQVKPKKANMTSLDIAAWCINFVLTFFLINVSVFQGLTYGVTLIYFAFFAFATFYIVSKTKTFSKKAILPGAAAILCALSYSLHESTTLSFVAFLALIYLSGSYCVKLTGSNRHSDSSYFYLLDILKCEVLLPLGNLFTPLICLGTLKKKEHKKQNKKAILGVTLGILLAVPVLLIVVPLLQKGDVAFDNLVGNAVSAITDFFERIRIFDYFFDEHFDYIPTFFATCVFAPYIYSVMFAFRHGIADKENKDTSAAYAKLRFAKSSLIGPFLGVISLVYVVYLFSQLSYLFSAFTGHLPGGLKITVAEYAIKGFSEMATIAVINFALIGISVLFAKRKDGGKLTSLVKWFDLFLCIFTLIITASSISKILLYISIFGLTEKRIYVFAFDIVLVIAVICVIIRLFKQNFPYMKIILIGGFAIFTALNLIGTETIITNYNVDMYLAGKIKCSNIETLIEVNTTSLKVLDKLEKKAPYYARRKIGELTAYYNSSEKPQIDNYDKLKAFKYYKKNKDRFDKYRNEYYSSDNVLYVYLDTAAKIESIEIFSDNYIHIPHYDSKLKSGELVRFYWDSSRNAEEEKREFYSNILYNEKKNPYDWALISITTKDGKTHEATVKMYKVYKDNDMNVRGENTNCLSIQDSKNGFTVKAHFGTTEMTYNQILAQMQKS